jgi:predicted lysophospholipase L1 biosynthesis ABC-type transport system permease subunit
MEALVAGSAVERRFALIVFTAFAITALLLAAAGLYGVLAGSFAERTREIGVRSALGATRGDILRLVSGQAMRVTALGVGLGIVGAAAATRAIAGLLFGVTPLDPLTYGAVLTVLVAVAAMAAAVEEPVASPTEETVDFRPVSSFDSDETVTLGVPATWGRRIAGRIDSAISGAIARLGRHSPAASTRPGRARKR